MIRVNIIYAIVGLSFICQRCDADLFVSIDLDPNTSGIQSHVAVLPGAPVTASVIIDFTDSSSLSAYGFSLRFDTQELNFVSRAETPIPGLDQVDVSNPSIEDTGMLFIPVGQYGELGRFDGQSLLPGPSSGSFNVAQIVFNAVTPFGDLSDIDILPGLFDNAFDGFADNLNAPATVTFNGATVSAIPEPSSFGLLGVTSYAVLVRRRNRKRC